MSGRCDFFMGATVICGDCGARKEFAKARSGGGDTLARQAGWVVKHGPQPFVRCPTCAPPPAPEAGVKLEEG